MTFAHIADLHIGKKLYEINLLEDQAYVLDFIASEVHRRALDAVFISGDLYDRAIPSAEAVTLCGDFLTRLARGGAQVFVIGGNHDSQERLAFARAMLAREGLVISAPYAGRLEKYAVGKADIWLMPHIRPREVERYFDGAAFESAADAVEAVLARERENIDRRRVNIILAHQFVSAAGSAPDRSDSEVEPIGGEAQVDARAFDAFDYVALGHLHAPQRVGRECARYAGSPLKYSFSEARHKKSMVVGRAGAQGVEIELVPLPARRGMRNIRGKLEDILSAAESTDDYVRVTLTDQTPPIAAMERLAAAYPNIARLELAPRAAAEIAPLRARERSPIELFAEFYERTTGEALSAPMRRMAVEALDAVTENS